MKRGLMAWLFVIACVSSARADAVGPPPDDCAPGLIGRTSHGGPSCAPDACSAGACSAGRECEHVSFCTEHRPGYGIGGPFTEDVSHGRCDVDADCDAGQRCVASDVCVDRSGLRTRRLAWIAGVAGLVAFVTLAVFRRARRRA